MKTPICDFVNEYAKINAVRLHMPGHKGKKMLGIESLDITEISGADSLYEASGIIRESEKNASRLFGCETYYSTEGSSHCIRAMLYLIVLHAKNQGKKPLVLAGRNAHKTFLSACAMLDFETEWIYPENGSYLSCRIDAKELDMILHDMSDKPTAVYITNPDYTGNSVDIKSISDVCRKHGVFLAVDNAHGAYLKFLPESLHPIDLGADICCDSAHKTLPVLTGGAYLHVSDNAPQCFINNAKNSLALFGSTSPSYIIMQSLDYANKYLSQGYPERLAETVQRISLLKEKLVSCGFSFVGDEPLKLTFDIKKFGYTGIEFSEFLSKNNIFTEFSDSDFTVMMFTPETDEKSFDIIEKTLASLKKREKICDAPPPFSKPERVVSVREACFSSCERISARDSCGRILAVSDIGCPPAVPIIMCGERIDRHTVECFEYYGIEHCTVIK